MRKVISLIMAVSIISVVGCSDNTKVTDEDTKIQQSLKNHKITETVIENSDIKFEPLFYDNEVYGVGTLLNNKHISEDEIKQPYLVNENGEFQKLEENRFSNNEKRLIESTGMSRLYGIYNEGLNTGDKHFYYVDFVNNINIKLEGYEQYIYDMQNKGYGTYNSGFKINEDYYIDMLFLGKEEEKKPGKQDKVAIVDIKHKVVYTTNTLEKEYAYFYYDKKEQCIMAIDSLGKVSKVILKDNKINFEDYKSIDMKGLTINLDTMPWCKFRSGDNIILGLSGGKENVEYGIYNIYSNEIAVAEGSITTSIENSDLFIASINEKLYLCGIRNNEKFEPIFKINDTDGKNLYNVKAIGNEKGNSIFLVKANDDTKSDKSKIEYSFIKIEE